MPPTAAMTAMTMDGASTSNASNIASHN